MLQYFENIKKSRHVLHMLVVRDVFSKYRKSLLGVAWSMITPLSMVGVIGLVYSVVFGTPLIGFLLVEPLIQEQVHISLQKVLLLKLKFIQKYFHYEWF